MLKPSSIIAFVSLSNDLLAGCDSKLPADGEAIVRSDNLEDAHTTCSQAREGCMILDNEFPGCDKIKPAEIPSRYPVLLAVNDGCIDEAFAGFSKGFVGVVSKSAAPGELRRRIDAALQAQRAVIRGSGSHYQSATFEKLTDREKQVLGLLSRGESNKRVAAKLDMGLRTVELDRSQIMKKMRAKSFAHLIQIVSEIETNVVLDRQMAYIRFLNMSSQLTNGPHFGTQVERTAVPQHGENSRLKKSDFS